MQILVTNDDGITSAGIRALVEVAQQYGEVTVIAPDKPQSAMGHAITINNPLRLAPVSIFEGINAYACSGTPVDCVKLGIDKILHKKPDMCFSGINHGANAATNIIYSGTMSAATEAAMSDIPSIGFSLLNFSAKADMTTAKFAAHQVIKQVLTNGIGKHNLLNVNVPDVAIDQIKGIKICRQADAKWQENYHERTDPLGRKYFWLAGEFVNHDTGEDSDMYALKQNYISVVPVQYDLTAYDDVAFLQKNWEFK